jgi:hypothetical protein
LIDTREDILARLLVVVASIPNIRSSYRNNVDISENQMPAAIVLDGDEQAHEALNRQSNSPIMVEMTPGIVLQVTDDNVDLGSTITTFRRDLIRLVLFDTVLNDLIVKSSPRGNGAIRYLGCNTDVGWTRTGWAALTAQFMFKYTLRPEQL